MANSGSYSSSSGVSPEGPERSSEERTQSHSSSCSSLASPSSKDGALGPWLKTRRRSSAAASSSSRRMERRSGGRSRRGRRGASTVAACDIGGRTAAGSSLSRDRPRRGRRGRGSSRLLSFGPRVGLVSSGVVGKAAPRPKSMNQSSSLSSHSHFFSFMSLFK